MRAPLLALGWSPGARLRLGLVVAALLAVVLFTPRAPLSSDVLLPLDLFTAKATSGLLGLCGLEVARQGAVLSDPAGFAYEVYWRCTGLLPAVFLAVIILASPASGRSRTIGVAAGLAAVVVVNLVRLASLFWIGVRHPVWFPFAHSVLWEAATVLLVIVLWLGWTRWAARSEGQA